MADKIRVCVTGAGGYVASWLVKLLLSNRYIVHGTVRNPKYPTCKDYLADPDRPFDRDPLDYPDDEKNFHLKKLEGASENLKLFKADLLDYNSLYAAITGCEGVFHVASPVPPGSVANPEVELIEPAVKGTLNVLKVCSDAKVKRVVFVSSAAAVSMNPNWPKDKVQDETCWSDKDYCRETKNFYSLSKTLAESEASEYARRGGLDMVAVCPTIVVGPMLQSSVNASSLALLKLLKEGYESTEDRLWKIVDVRDVAEALLLVYERPEAERRYICTAHIIKKQDVVNKLRSMYPNYNYPKSFTEVEDGKLTSEKLQKFGWKYRPLEETLADSVRSYQEAGLLD